MDELTQKMEIYKTYVPALAAIGDQRQRAVAVHFGMFVLVVSVAGSVGQSSPLFLLLSAILVSCSWSLKIRYYQQLEEVKLSVIAELEQDLSFTAFQNETERFRKNHPRRNTLTDIDCC